MIMNVLRTTNDLYLTILMPLNIAQKVELKKVKGDEEGNS